MKARWWLPGPAAWLSAVALYIFLSLYGMVASTVLPQLWDMLRDSPHVAMLGALALWLGPVLVIALVNQAAHAALDGIDPKEKIAKGVVPNLGSWWSGFYAWLVMLFTTITTTFVLLVIWPPRPPDPDMMTTLRDVVAMEPGQGTVAAFYLGTWIFIAAFMFNMERLVKDRQRKKAA